MNGKNFSEIKSSEITDKKDYLNRRQFMRGAALVGTTAATALLYRKLNPAPVEKPRGDTLLTVQNNDKAIASRDGFTTNEKLTDLQAITNYNNFYEFSTTKEGVAIAAAGFVTNPWNVEVGGLVNKPATFGLEELLRFPQEERIYRLRCVEGWSMVIPWVGFPLAKLLERVEPNARAKYVAFQTLYDPKRMPNQATGVLDWPYVEGLRLDEAMHPLTLLATGLYGETLPPQDGAPIRLVVPWKYGYKSIKSIVKISLTAEEPPTAWNRYSATEYGFYSNVNPKVSHPRWSQEQEHRVGDSPFSSRDTLLFNGYAEQVAYLYEGMDLRRNH
jgi:sulfoxide reductase catalytic subunit YedY